MTLVIAIDGPAASGKGTLARRLAAYYGLNRLDTGLTYRAVAQALLQAGLPLDNEALAEIAAQNIDLAKLDADILSDHAIGEAASKIAAMPAVRRALVMLQRAFATQPPGAVLDGRDIGTVVCPDAPVKLYVTADASERARRRHAEILGKNGAARLDDIFADIVKRDARDMGRSDSPLRPAADAHLIDTSSMAIETAFDAAVAIVEKSLAGS